MLTMCAVKGTVRSRRHHLIRRLASGVFALVLLGTGTTAALANAVPSRPGSEPVLQTASQAPGPLLPSRVETEITVLRPDDQRRYQRIFALQEDGRWPEADKLIRELEDNILLGHVLAQRYLHPTAYRSKFAELRDWLAEYHDHPQATRIHALAMKRRPADARAPHAPTTVRLSFRGDVESFGFKAPKLPKGGKADAERADRAARAFVDGKNAEALKLAQASITSTGCAAARACWIAGLANWRLGNYAAAAGHFERLTQSDWADPWTKAGAGFWAARAYLRAGKPDKVAPLMEGAAAYPRTFYGLLAARTLGLTEPFEVEAPVLTDDGLKALAAAPAGLRALALLEAGRTDGVEDELRQVDPRKDPELAEAVIALVERARLPALGLELGTTLRTEGGAPYDAALYPLPGWEPQGGFTLDRALVFAIMRQESRFQANARSSAGATGLMQLMPGTAGAMAAQLGLPRTAAAYRDPEINLALGQGYIAYLLQDDAIENNLFRLTTAYNSGPGKLGKWLKTVDYQDDPLLFIETIPSMETRRFIERVLANYWIYRLRLGQDVPSLDTLAEGGWPIYRPSDDLPAQVAERLPD